MEKNGVARNHGDYSRSILGDHQPPTSDGTGGTLPSVAGVLPNCERPRGPEPDHDRRGIIVYIFNK